MTDFLFVQGMLIGIIFGVPVGAVGALTIQRAIKYGFISGLVTGLGASIGDIIYCCLSLCGITLITQFFSQNQMLVSVVGGVFIIAMGMFILKSNTEQDNIKEAENELVKANYLLFFTSSLVIAITNPATIFSFIFVFASTGIRVETFSQGCQFTIGLLLGTLVWWLLLSGGASLFRNKMTLAFKRKLNTIFAISLFVFAVVMILRAIFS